VLVRDPSLKEAFYPSAVVIVLAMRCQAFCVSEIKLAQKIWLPVCLYTCGEGTPWTPQLKEFCCICTPPIWWLYALNCRGVGRRAAYRLPRIHARRGDASGGPRWVFRERCTLGKKRTS